MIKSKLFLFVIFMTFSFSLYYINQTMHTYYVNLYEKEMANTIMGDSAPRGRILDRNGIVLVDNRGVLNIGYHEPLNITSEEEIAIAKQLTDYIEPSSNSLNDLKKYFLVTHQNGDNLITKEEQELYDKQKLSDEDIDNLKWDRVKEEDLNYSEEEQKIIYLYTRMNQGYRYQDKILLKDLPMDTITKIMDLKIPALKVLITSERTYPYVSLLKSILGTVGSIPKENVNTYLKNGYNLNDLVGTSGLEEEYESILKGKKALYEVNSDNSLTLLEKEEPGSDITLNLDIELEQTLVNTLQDELKLARTKKTSKYFHDAYAFIGDPNTGGVLAMSGVRISDKGEYSDITLNAFTSSYAMGSVVKGASSTVGYLSNAITVGKKVKDSCVKLQNEPSKCSYKKLGYVDDVSALKTSSNYFQFITAIRSTGKTYKYNMNFDVTENDFDRYRNVFSSYGLGSKTGIDYPMEDTGLKGSKIAGDLLLNLAIGQYDNYTPISLLQYINTIANRGNRYALRLKKEDYSEFLNQVNLESIYYDRIIEGFYEVFHGGTASSYVNKALNACGKTGTSETFYDSNQDNIVDTSVINSTVAFYYPRENPEYSVVVVAPYITDSANYTYPFTRNVSKKVTQALTSFQKS